MLSYLIYCRDWNEKKEGNPLLSSLQLPHTLDLNISTIEEKKKERERRRRKVVGKYNGNNTIIK